MKRLNETIFTREMLGAMICAEFIALDEESLIDSDQDLADLECKYKIFLGWNFETIHSFMNYNRYSLNLDNVAPELFDNAQAIVKHIKHIS